MKRVFWFSSLLMSLGCAKAPPAGPEPVVESPAPQAPSEPSMSADSFPSALFTALNPSDESNLFLSPLSVQMALAMTAEGAAGGTASEMWSTLGLPGDSDTLHAATKTLLDSLGSVEGATLRLANRLWADQRFPLEPAYTQVTGEVYGAPITALDFQSEPEPARQTINGWVSGQTETLIPELIPAGAITPSTQLVLTNAIYFKGTWVHPFKEADTRDETFNTPAGPITHPMMHQVESLAYGRRGDVAALEIPYEGGRLSMRVLLPDDADAMASLRAQLDDSWFGGLSDELLRQPVDLTLPKFSSESSIFLKNTLATMGMPSAFGPQADFSKISSQPLLISEVIHKAFIKVNEEGTEAAAATGVLMRTTSMPMQPQPPVSFVVDRPFLYYIWDNEVNQPLFVGQIVNPS